ncbi:MAG TPA: SDR family NAD(P)-dependent oxidoreductase, partial [Legionellaceae bacterium]|nr:SDR family NAD(P)-dependent oxidoreductase [Legionellaceae bacterium]
AYLLAERGEQILIIGRDERALQETAASHANIMYYCANVQNNEDRRHILEFVSQQNITRLKGLIHNAGIIEPIVSMTDICQEAWHRCIVTNLEAPFFLTQLLLPYLHHSKVLHIGSGAAHFPVKGWSAYCVSKAALAMLTRCWQLEASSFAVASVMPGIVDTAMQATIRDAQGMDSKKHEFFCNLKSNQRLLTPETVASFLAWLLLEVSSEVFVSKEWDIYDRSHHAQWLHPPHQVPAID